MKLESNLPNELKTLVYDMIRCGIQQVDRV